MPAMNEFWATGDQEFWRVESTTMDTDDNGDEFAWGIEDVPFPTFEEAWEAALTDLRIGLTVRIKHYIPRKEGR